MRRKRTCGSGLKTKSPAGLPDILLCQADVPQHSGWSALLMPQPFAPTSDQGSGHRRFRWTPLRVIAALVCGLLLAVATIFWIGPPLQPWDDLNPQAIPPLAHGEKNGRGFLKMKWEPLRDFLGFYSMGKLDRLQESAIPWEEADPEMIAAAMRGADRIAELREALAMPGWRVEDYERVSDQYSDRLHLYPALTELSASILQHIHARRMEEAADAILLLAEASQREIQAAPLSDRLLQGIQIRSSMLLAIPPFLAAATPGHDSLCVKLQEACRAESITSSRIKGCLLRDVDSRCHDLLTLPRRERVPEKDWPESRGYHIGEGFRRFFLHSKATVNLFHNALRAAVPRLLAPVPQETDSLKGLTNAYSMNGKWWLYLHPNGDGHRYVADELFGWQSLDTYCRDRLFQERAVVVRIALHRWQLAKGRLPDRLEDLVPGLLDAVPADPYDGKPLRWVSAGGGMLYAVGSDWTDAVSDAFPVTGRAPGYFNQDYETPALRLELPAAKKPVP